MTTHPLWRCASILIVCAGLVDVGTAQAPDSDGSRAIARVGDQTISVEDFERYWQQADPASFARAKQQAYENQIRVLETLVGEHVLARHAARLKIDVDTLLAREGEQNPVTEAEVRTLYELSPASKRMTLDQARPAIEVFLTQQRRAQERAALVGRLRSSGRDEVEILIDRPRQAVRVSSENPSEGPADAPIQIVVFSDFECPYCRQAAPILRGLVQRFPGRVRLVWKDFPLPTHTSAQAAAEAGQCANDQGVFWAFHDLTFENQSDLSTKALRHYVQTVGANMEQFDACLRSSQAMARVASMRDEGRGYGVSATPTTFVNGRMVVGVGGTEELVNHEMTEWEQRRKE